MQTIDLKEFVAELDPEILKLLDSNTENYTIVHCKYINLYGDEERIRIWPTTYLIQDDGVRKKLLHAYNIPVYPNWGFIKGSIYRFTLLFEGLDKGCRFFDLLEDIPEGGEFFVSGIKRNHVDVYKISIS